MEFPEHGSLVPPWPCTVWHNLCWRLHHDRHRLRTHPLAAGLCTCRALPWCFPLTSVTPGEQQIYREKVSKWGLEVLHTMETKSTLMPEFLLPPQTTLVLLCSYRTKQPQRPPSRKGPRRLPGLGSLSQGEDQTPYR